MPRWMERLLGALLGVSRRQCAAVIPAVYDLPCGVRAGEPCPWMVRPIECQYLKVTKP